MYGWGPKMEPKIYNRKQLEDAYRAGCDSKSELRAFMLGVLFAIIVSYVVVIFR
jgi:hypothetical protein